MRHINDQKYICAARSNEDLSSGTPSSKLVANKFIVRTVDDESSGKTSDSVGGSDKSSLGSSEGNRVSEETQLEKDEDSCKTKDKTESDEEPPALPDKVGKTQVLV